MSILTYIVVNILLTQVWCIYELAYWLRLRRKRGLIGWLLGSREIKMIPVNMHAVTYSKYWAYQMILMFFSGCFFTICYVATVFVHVGGQVNEWGSGVEEARETAFGWVVAVTAVCFCIGLF